MGGGSSVAVPSRLVLLGPGGAGKSTLFKQIRLRYAKGFTDAELAVGASAVRAGLLLTLRLLVRHDAVANAPVLPLSLPFLHTPHTAHTTHCCVGTEKWCCSGSVTPLRPRL